MTRQSLRYELGSVGFVVFLLTSVQVASGIQFVDAILVGCIVGYYSLAGIVVFQIRHAFVDQYTRNAIGFLTITFLVASLDQVLPNSLQLFTWLLLPSLLLMVRIAFNVSRARHQLREYHIQGQYALPYYLFPLVFFVLAPVFRWAFVTSLLTGVALVLLWPNRSGLTSQSRRIRELGTCALLGAVCVYVPYFTGDSWSNFRWGVDEGLALAKSVFSFGTGDSIYSAGLPIKYQWLSHSLTGFLDLLNHGDLFTTTSRTIWIVGAVTLLLVGRGIILLITPNIEYSLPAFFLLISSSSIPLTPVSLTLLNISAGGIQTAYLLCFVACVLVFIREKSLSNGFLVGFVGIGTVVVRSVHIVFVLLLLLFCLHHAIRTRQKSATQVTLGLSVLAVLGYYTLFLPVGSGTGLQIRPFRFDFVGDIGYPGLGQPSRIIVGVVLIAAVIALPLIAVLNLRGDYSVLRWYLVAALFSGAVLSSLLTRTSYGELHFVQVPFLASLPFLGCFLSEKCNFRGIVITNRFRLLVLVFSILSTWIVTSFLGATLVFGRSDAFYNYAGHALGFVILCLVISTVLSKAVLARGKIHQQLWRITTTCVVIQFIFVSTVGHYRHLMTPVPDSALRPKELTLIGEWVRDNTSVDSVFVTNLLIAGPETDPLPPELCPTPGSRASVQDVSTAMSGSYYLPAAHLQRRFIAVGPEYGFFAFPNYRETAVRSSIEIACGSSIGFDTLNQQPTFILRYVRNGLVPEGQSGRRLRFRTAHLFVYEISS